MLAADARSGGDARRPLEYAARVHARRVTLV
jgi:hypothetical protein